MSSPVSPPLRVETVDGATSGRPITTIKVTNGDLTISGSVATIDTSGGGGGGTGTVTSVGTSQAFITITDPTTTPSISIGNASGAATGVLTAASFNTFDAKQDAITLTTTGTSGAATFAGSTLNIPQYSGTTGTVTGTGTSGQVSYWNGTSSQTGSANLTFDGTNLKVGGYTEVGTKITTPTGIDLTLDTVNGTDSGSIVIADGVDGQVSISANGAGAIKLGAATNPVTVSNVYTLPTAVTTDNGYVLTAQTDGSTAWAASGGGGGSPGGSDTELQYNDGGSFGGISSVTFNDTSNYLTIDPTRTIIGAGPAFDSGLTVTDDTNFRNSQTKFADGTAAAPSITFWNNGDDDTGIYRAAANEMGFTVGGNERMKVANDAVTAIIFQTNGTGTAAAPTYSFSSATNLGFFKDGSTAVSFTSGGTRQMTFDANGVIRLGGSGSKLTTYSNNLVLDTDIGVNSGSIVIEAGANGQISLTPNGTGTIKLDGVELDNTAIATGYVLKATSATAAGWAAESGGSSGGLIPPQIGTMSFLGSYNRYTTCSTPFAVQGIETNETSSQYDQNPIARPFILPEGGTWGGIEIKVTTASTSNSMLVALYNADSTTGTPTSLVGYCDIDTTSTGNITQTTTLDSSGSSATITLSANTQYWVSIVANANSDSCSLRVTLHESLTTLGSTTLSNLTSVLRNTFVSNAIETNNPPRFTQGLADRNFPVIGVIV